MLCKCHWIVLYTVHVTAFSLGNVSLGGFPFIPGCIDRWVMGRGVLHIGWKDADCKIVLVAYSV